MMKRFHVLALVAICVLAGCKQSSSSQSDGSVTIEVNGVVTCDFDQVKDTLTIPLSEWVEDFQIVRFEDNDTAIFKMRGHSLQNIISVSVNEVEVPSNCSTVKASSFAMLVA